MLVGMVARALATAEGGGTLGGMGEDTVRDEVRIERRTNASGVFGRSRYLDDYISWG